MNESASPYTLVLLWWDPKDGKVHEKRWNRDQLYEALKAKETLVATKRHILAQFAVTEKTNEFAGAW